MMLKRNKMAKGCGCQKGVLKYFKPPFAKTFYAACCVHDDDYDIGGTEDDRMVADKRLYYNMLKIAARETRPAKTTILVIASLTYFACVRILGRYYFNYK